MKNPTPRTNWRELLCMLALAVFVFRALVPAGFMPGVGADGHAGITICSEYGQSTLAVDENGQPAKDTPAHKQPCWFAAHASGFTPATAAALVSAVYAQISVPSFAQPSTLKPNYALPAPSRAPPAA